MQNMSLTSACDFLLIRFSLVHIYIYIYIGVLEYNPLLPERQAHRQFLTERAVFKEVVPLRDEEVIAIVQHTFRLQYLRV